MARYLYSQAAAPVTSLDAVNLAAIAPTSAAPVTQDEFALIALAKDRGQRRVNWQFTLTNAVTSITVELQGSIDGTNWFTVQANALNAPGAGVFDSAQLNFSFKFMRLAITALSGGAGSLNAGKIYQF